MEYEFELIQGGINVAGSSSKDRETALREIEHYALMYSEDGPVEIREVTPPPVEPDVTQDAP